MTRKAFFSFIIKAVSYDGLVYNLSSFNIPLLLSEYLSESKLSLMLKAIEPFFTEYVAFKKKIIEFSFRINDSSFKEIEVIS